MFAGDVIISPEDWWQSVGIYRSSLDLSDQILRELPHFLANEQKKKFNMLSTYFISWITFYDLFSMVFLPADNQECL